jgi:hypothetical protein
MRRRIHVCHMRRRIQEEDTYLKTKHDSRQLALKESDTDT